MRETERQRTERMLKEQLARFEQAQVTEAPVRSHRGPWGLTLARRFLARSPVAWGLAGMRGQPRRHPGKHKPGAAELLAETQARRAERTFDDLYAAAMSDPPRRTWERRDSERPVSSPRGSVRSPERDLPNGSGGGARVAAMPEMPARDWGPPPKVQFPRPVGKKGHRSDFIVAALGVVLGLTCALFPWYIFFNQEQFGVQAISFGGRGHNAGRIMVDPKSGEDVADVARQEMSKNLDLFSTGTVPAKSEAPAEAPGLDQQPFPGEAAKFSLVHVANGRAMIEDDAGLWIVQQGSSLPDSTRVKSIEKRDGQWVLVTSADRVIELAK